MVYPWNCLLQPGLPLKIFIRCDNFLSVVWSQGWALPNKNLIKHTLPTSTTSYIYFKKRHSKFTSYFSNFLALEQYIANTHSQTPKPWIIHSPSVCFPLAHLKWMSKGQNMFRFWNVKVLVLFWVKTREKCISFAQLVLLSLYIFWGKCVYFSFFER